VLETVRQAVGILERRFLLNAFFPSLIFWSAIAFVIALPRGVISVASVWATQPATVQIIFALGFLAWSWFWAGIIASQWRSLIRIYEGYWHKRVAWLLRLGRAWHEKRMDTVFELGEADTQYFEYPQKQDKSQLMPTRIGNILKSAERYAFYRYRADAIIVWPRLYHLFPERFVKSVDDARAALEFLLVVSVLSVIFAVFAGSYLLIVGASWWVFLLCFWGSLALAVGTCYGSVGSALDYGEHLKAGFDLYRTSLFEQLRLVPPEDLDSERELWNKVVLFLYRDLPHDLPYAAGQGSPSHEPVGPSSGLTPEGGPD
jgi:hypothetical protein